MHSILILTENQIPIEEKTSVFYNMTTGLSIPPRDWHHWMKNNY